MSSAIPGLPATTIAPPSAGPITQSRFLVRPRSAFACCSRSALTVCGTSPISAGRTKPSPMPYAAWSAARSATDARPESTKPAVAACAPPWTSKAADEHTLARQAVSDHASEQHHCRVCDLAAGDDDPEIGGARPVQLEHGECQRDRPDGVAERRDRRRREQQPVVALDERAEALTKGIADTAGSVRAMLLGAHCVRRGQEGARPGAELELDAMQLFAQSPRAWRYPEHDPKDLAASASAAASSGSAESLSFALPRQPREPEGRLYEKSVDDALDGRHRPARSRRRRRLPRRLAPRRRARGRARRVVPRCGRSSSAAGHTWLLLENSAGAGGTIGRSIDELAALIDALDRPPRLGICLDSCHLWVSGVDVTDPARSTRCSPRSTTGSGSTGCARSTSTTPGAARLEPRPPRKHARGADGREARRVPRPPEAAGSPGGARGRGPGRPRRDEAEMNKVRGLHARWREAR